MLMSAQKTEVDDVSAGATLETKLAAAHGQIERKFLDGGAVLIAIIEILNRLIRSLDQLTGSLDESTTSETMAGIQGTADELASLPGFEDDRQKGFVELASVCEAMQGSIDEMRETMRYLRTFAISVKITAAGLADFAGFADEIRERIQSGEAEVERFAKQVQEMHVQLQKAQDFSTRIRREYADVVPATVADLRDNAARISRHHAELAAMANAVKQLARGVQGKITSVLSALQIGDITRQRIEHIQSTFQLCGQFLADEGASLPESARERIKDLINQLAAAQMEETFADFQRECRNIHANMGRFVDDAQEILHIRDEMTMGAGDGGGAGVLKALESGVARAVGLVGGVADTSRQADDVAQSTSETAQSLLRGIEVIRTIKTDIHYMALNSNLRCSRLGDEGRPVAVVSAELRIYAGKLEVPADAVMNELQRLESAANAFSSARGASGDIAGPLGEALTAIQGVSARMDAGIAELAHEGQEVFAKVSAAISSLDFESELGDVLEDCMRHAAAASRTRAIDISDTEERVAPLGARIFKLYTMAQEREIHLGIMPSPLELAAAAVPTTAAAPSDDDLFEDALF